MGAVSEGEWYAVRCLFEVNSDGADHTYEERITVWLAASPEEAIDKAELEAGQYAEAVGRYLAFAQSYHLTGGPGDGAEVFSLMRDSPLTGLRPGPTRRCGGGLSPRLLGQIPGR